MAVAIDTARLALRFIPEAQRRLDRTQGDDRRFHIHRINVYATILPRDSEIYRQQNSRLGGPNFIDCTAKREALDWQADPEDDLGDAAVLHHLHQQAATVPVLSSVIAQSDQGNAATTLIGSALSASINDRTQGTLLSSFHCHSFRLSLLDFQHPKGVSSGCSRRTSMSVRFPSAEQDFVFALPHFIVWAGPKRDGNCVFMQVQLDVIDLFSRRTLPTSRPRKRRQTAFNPFLQVSDSPVVQDTSRGNPLPHARRFNGVRHRLDRRTWVAEMKPPKHERKQDFGNFKSEVEAARAVDAAFHHYGRPHLLNFPDTSLQFLSTRPTVPPGLDEKAKVKFVKEEAKLLLAATAATSTLHARSCSSGALHSLSEFSSPVSCSGPDEVDAAVSQPQQWMDLESVFDISTSAVQETVNSVQSAEQGWDWSADSSTLTAPPNVVNPSDYMWLDSLIRSSPASTNSRSPSPRHFQEEIAHALLEQQSI